MKDLNCSKVKCTVLTLIIQNIFFVFRITSVCAIIVYYDLSYEFQSGLKPNMDDQWLLLGNLVFSVVREITLIKKQKYIILE